MTANLMPVLTEADSDETETERRTRIHLAISNHVNELTADYVKEVVESYLARLAEAKEGEPVTGPPERMRLNTLVGQRILAGVTEIIFRATLSGGYFRFPDGYGSFHVHRVMRDQKPKRLPTGKIVEMPPKRLKFKYEDGAAVRDALGLSKKTNYVRLYDRKSKLSKRTLELLDQRD